MSDSTDLIKRLGIFIQERFEPISHFMMIFVFWWAHQLLAQGRGDVFSSVLIFLGISLFFLKLRFYDEIKDYETDKIINPDRPLARGLITIKETKGFIFVCLVLIVLCFALVSVKSLVAIVLTLIYGLLMYHEFFISKLIRPHLTTYATSHTVVTFFLSVSIICAYRDQYPWQLTPMHYSFALMSWLLFNVFELGRKTYQASEEREGVDTYSKIWTRPGAVALVLVQAGAAVYLGPFVETIETINWLIVFLLGLSGVWFILDKREISAKVYRSMSSVIIVLIYLTVIVSEFMNIIDQK